MSMELLVALPTKDTITAEDIMQPARQLGLDLVLPPDFSLNAASGFQPGELAGEKTGAEIHLYDREDVEDMAELFGEKADSLVRVVAFYWGSGFIEGAFADAVAAALVAQHGGVCFDPQEDAILSAERLVEITHGMVAEARNAAVKSA